MSSRTEWKYTQAMQFAPCASPTGVPPAADQTRQAALENLA